MKISDTKFIVIDTETTGLNPEVDRVVEISLVEVSKRGVNPVFDTLIDPQCAIPPTASAVHHITAKDVEGKPKFEEIWPIVMSFVEDAVIVAHNATFDKSMLPETDRPWLCSLRLARHLWPDAPAYGNQVLRYWLGIDINSGMTHRATADTLVTAFVLIEELKHYRAQFSNNAHELLTYANSPIQVNNMPFGKYRGKAISQLPQDYVNWALNNLSDLDPDVRWSLEQFLPSSNSAKSG